MNESDFYKELKVYLCADQYLSKAKSRVLSHFFSWLVRTWFNLKNIFLRCAGKSNM